MSSSNFIVKPSEGRELRVDLFGVLDVPTAEALSRSLAEALSALTPPVLLLINSTGINDCTMDAREVLVRMLKASAPLARTAWWDDRSRFRGMALWVMHLAADPNARAVATLEQARQWLGGDQDRVALAQQTAGAVG